MGTSAIFSGLGREHFAELCHRAQDQSVAARQFLFLEGDPAEYCYLIGSGMIKMLKHSSSGTNFITGIYGPGEVLSHILLFTGKVHSSSAQAVVDSTVVAIRNDDFVSFLHRQPGVGIDILARMLNVSSQRHRAATVRLIDLAAERTDRRLARVLVALSSKFGPSIALSRAEIAEMAGTTTETASRFVTRLRQEGMVKTVRGKVIVLDEDALQSVALVS
ncbi:MAG: Crp/Fnr family transcriptional regulator [Chloroflexi bacterium]|nr:Crp/Fnr family transcriptional regulator [Chloroflexota bacterium]